MVFRPKSLSKLSELRFARSLLSRGHVESLEESLAQIRWIKEESTTREEALGRIRRRCRGEPLQYVLESTYFGPCKLECRPPILIPRPSTEHWVQELVNRIKLKRQGEIACLDIGTGSGAIAILLKTLRPEWKLFGIDKNPLAVTLARKNAEMNGSEVVFTEMDLFHGKFREDALALNDHDSFDIIVSNPPYLTDEIYEGLDPGVKSWEDRDALLARSPQGLGFHRRILELTLDSANCLIKKDGIVVLEIEGSEQASLLLKEAGSGASCWRDGYGDDRAVVIGI